MAASRTRIDSLVWSFALLAILAAGGSALCSCGKEVGGDPYFTLSAPIKASWDGRKWSVTVHAAGEGGEPVTGSAVLTTECGNLSGDPAPSGATVQLIDGFGASDFRCDRSLEPCCEGVVWIEATMGSEKARAPIRLDDPASFPKVDIVQTGGSIATGGSGGSGGSSDIFSDTSKIDWGTVARSAKLMAKCDPNDGKDVLFIHGRPGDFVYKGEEKWQGDLVVSGVTVSTDTKDRIEIWIDYGSTFERLKLTISSSPMGNPLVADKLYADAVDPERPVQGKPTIEIRKGNLKAFTDVGSFKLWKLDWPEDSAMPRELRLTYARTPDESSEQDGILGCVIVRP